MFMRNCKFDETQAALIKWWLTKLFSILINHRWWQPENSCNWSKKNNNKCHRKLIIQEPLLSSFLSNGLVLSDKEIFTTFFHKGYIFVWCLWTFSFNPFIPIMQIRDILNKNFEWQTPDKNITLVEKSCENLLIWKN
jgi:hypothetical protein